MTAPLLRFTLAAALLTSGCATGALLDRAPDRTYHSAKSVDALADCLMDRSASGDFRVHREAATGATLVRVTGVAGTYFVFRLMPAPGGGSDAEMRRANTMAPGLHNAETCF